RGRAKLDYNKMINIPIPIIKEKSKKLFSKNADLMLELNRQFQKKKTRFLNRVKDNFELEKISKKLGTFYDFDFKVFVSELKKQKIKLSLIQQDEWEEYFSNYKTELNQLQTEIKETDQTIDKMVYELYKLTAEEIKIVEG
ncbi:MAG: Eco57I restriction-modification methylase domain-containing protein, partial [Alphaproteobacteria bacterium]